MDSLLLARYDEPIQSDGKALLPESRKCNNDYLNKFFISLTEMTNWLLENLLLLSS